MANEVPLFNADLDTLQERLRASGFKSDEDIQKVLELKVKTVRILFYDRLGVSRIDALLALGAEPDNPTDEDGIMRAKASVAEVLAVRIELMKELPTMFLDSSGPARQEWNAYPFRNTSRGEIEGLIETAQEELDLLLEELTGTDQEGTGRKLNVFTIQPDPDITFRPGDTVYVNPERDSSGD